MKRLVRWLIVIAALALLIPAGAFIGFGLINGLDVANALRHLFVEPRGTTIDPDDVPRRDAEVRWLGNIDELAVNEASGLAASNRAEDVLWVVNDSGNEARLFAMSPRGEHLGSRGVDLPTLSDWEDLASFTIDGRPYLMIADVGDNYRWRPVVNLHILPEPPIAALRDPVPLQVERTIRYRYPDGPRDSEAVAVDPTRNEVLIIAKRVIPAELYHIPLDAPTDRIVTAERIALLDGIPQPTERDLYEDPRYGKSRSSPTALDVSGRRAIVVTYQDAYLYERAANEVWGDAFQRIPERIALPLTGQQEAAAFSRDGRQFYTTVERSRGTNAAGIFQIRL